MRRFIDGDDSQFEWLRERIQGTLMTFNDVTLPVRAFPKLNTTIYWRF